MSLRTKRSDNIHTLAAETVDIAVRGNIPFMFAEIGSNADLGKENPFQTL